VHVPLTREEKTCRFCAADLPDWRAQALLPKAEEGEVGEGEGGGGLAPAYMRISYNGRSHKIRVRMKCF
jgi:hypothetical protein